MKTFLNQNRTFLVVALTLTLLALFKVNQAHASNPQWVHVHDGAHYDKTTLWSPKKGVYRFGIGRADSGFAVSNRYELDCAEATTRRIGGWVITSSGQTVWMDNDKPNEVFRYSPPSVLYYMDRLLCKR